MKSKIIYTLISLSLLANASCVKNEEPIYTPQPIAFTASVSSQATKVSLPDATNDSKFENDDKIGVYMKKSSETTAVTHNNVLHTSLDDKFVTGADPMMFHTHDLHDFISYHPHNSLAPATLASHDFTVNSDQTTQDLYTASDLMYAITPNVEPLRDQKGGTSVALEFSHKLSQIKVTVKNNVATTPFTGPRPALHMINPKSKVAINLADGNATTDDTENHDKVHFLLITPYVSGTTTSLDFIAIVPPHTINSIDVSFQLTTVMDYEITLTKDLVLKEGFQHPVNVTVDGLGLTVNGGDIRPWNDGIDIKHNIDNVNGRAATMNLDLTGSSVTNLSEVKSVQLTIDENTYEATVISATQTNNILVISYSQNGNWGVDLTQILLKDNNNQTLHTFTGAWSITGNPTAPDYDDILVVTPL